MLTAILAQHGRRALVIVMDSFSGVTMQDIYQKYQERGGLPVFHPENITAFTELHKSLFTLASSDDYIRDMRINSGLNEFLVLLMNESCNPAERSDAILKKQNLDPIREYLVLPQS